MLDITPTIYIERREEEVVHSGLRINGAYWHQLNILSAYNAHWMSTPRLLSRASLAVVDRMIQRYIESMFPIKVKLKRRTKA